MELLEQRKLLTLTVTGTSLPLDSVEPGVQQLTIYFSDWFSSYEEVSDCELLSAGPDGFWGGGDDYSVALSSAIIVPIIRSPQRTCPSLP